ncbi:MAG: hypothetical protein JST84_05820 [Acidobacteria bacterium]|nr:hypothetical protein [Acidobacteriota bacterium]
MKRAFVAILALLLVLPITGLAQKKKRSSTPARKPAPTAPPPAPDTRMEATQVADTIKSLSRFIFLYGKIVNGLEVAEEQNKKGRVAPRVIEQNVENKNGVINGIGGLKAQVDKLGQVLQANPRLQVPYINLAGVTQKITEAQDLVRNNQYDDAGRSLVTAIERLTDILMQIK